MADRMPHTPSAQLLERLACPRCDSALGDALACPSCQVAFPVHDGVPWLVADPKAIRLEWKNRWQMALRDLEQRQQSTRAGLQATESAATRARLEALADGYAAQHRALKLLLADLGLAGGADLTTYLALKTRLPTQMGLMAYEANVFRDWVWGQTENEAALGAIDAALAGGEQDTCLVLGAGAGRLAYDLHQPQTPTLTVAVELNPYLTTLTRKLADGEALTLVEFPLAPDSGAHSAIPRTLEAPAASAAGFEVVLADVMRPPFQAESFDLVVTPWLLDVIDGDPSALLGLVNRMLRPGGRWVFQGSLAFQRPDPLRNINLDELRELAEANGFEVGPIEESEQPYLDCPESRHGRRERIVTFAAHKQREAPEVPRQQSLPDWLAKGRGPVPALPSFQNQAMATRIHAFIMSLIDGQRSLKDMAEVMEGQQLMPKAEAEEAIRGFLIKMYDEAGSDRGL
jgi:uncharacterized protein YbaR (Trm112 family)/SAM-dependent methyltransferase